MEKVQYSKGKNAINNMSKRFPRCEDRSEYKWRISCKISKAKRYDERKMTEMNNYRISNILNTQKNKKNMMN